jgi:hypothetical protein
MTVDGPQTKSKLTILLALVPLSEREKRTRYRLAQFVVLADILIYLGVFILAFPQQWWAVSGAWAFINIVLAAWYFVLIRRAIKRGDLPSPWKV